MLDEALTPLAAAGDPVFAEDLVASLDLRQRGRRRPHLVAAMIASADGHATVEGRSTGLGHPADRACCGRYAPASTRCSSGRPIRAERYANLLDAGARAARDAGQACRRCRRSRRSRVAATCVGRRLARRARSARGRVHVDRARTAGDGRSRLGRRAYRARRRARPPARRAWRSGDPLRRRPASAGARCQRSCLTACS